MSSEGAPGRNRTCNPRVRNPLLYPIELRAQLVSFYRFARRSASAVLRGGATARDRAPSARLHRMIREERRLSAGLLVLLAAGVAAPLIVRNLLPLRNVDDAVYLAAGAAVAAGEIPYRNFVLTQLPGAEVLLAVWFRLAGASFTSVAVLTAALAWTTAALLYRAAAAAGGPLAGAAAALLWAWSPPVVAHHLFDREHLTALAAAAILAVEARPPRGRARDVSLALLAAAAFMVKATFAFAAVGAAAGIAAASPRRAARFLACWAAASAAALGLLATALGVEPFHQAVVFQAAKGSMPLVERLSAFAVAAGPSAVAAVAGLVVGSLRGAVALPAAFAAAALPLPLLGPTYWSHNAIDAAAPFAVLGGIGVARALEGSGGRVFAARAALASAALLAVFAAASGRLAFLYEGIPRAELEAVAAEVGRRSAPGDPVLAPAAVAFAAGRRPAVIDPEYLGVYRRMRETADRRGLVEAVREGAARSFRRAPVEERRRWADEAHAAVAAGAVRVAVAEIPPFDPPERRLDRSRLAAAGLAPVLRTARFEVWAAGTAERLTRRTR